MDEQNVDTNGNTGNTFPLGAGVDVLQSQNIDDVEIESYNDDLVGGGEMTPQDHIKKLKEKLREVNAERQRNLDGWQRSKADYVNYKRREEESKQDFLKYSRESIISELIPILDSFNMAFGNKEAWGKVDPSWRTGVEHIHTQLLQVLTANGLTEVNPIGEVFNPNEHTAVGAVETNDPTLFNKIAEVLQVGFRLHGKLIKSPNVKVYGEAPPHETKTTSTK